jgi:hypothetical protein
MITTCNLGCVGQYTQAFLKFTCEVYLPNSLDYVVGTVALGILREKSDMQNVYSQILVYFQIDTKWE